MRKFVEEIEINLQMECWRNKVIAGVYVCVRAHVYRGRVCARARAGQRIPLITTKMAAERTAGPARRDDWQASENVFSLGPDST